MAYHWPKEWPNVVDLNEVNIFDPDGDVLLQLQRTPLVEAPITEETPPVPDELQESEAADGEDVTLDATSPSEPLVDPDSPNLQRPTWAGEDVASEGRSQLGLEDELAPDTLNVYLQVSSRHLILASPMFKAMLSPDKFAEGNTLRSQGNLLIKLPDDPEALIILMYIVHGATRKVPRNITLDTMARLAKLVDYYHLHEAVELFSDTWVANLKQEGFPKSYTPDVVPWLFISWVFHKGDAFLKMTQFLIRECDDKSLGAMEHESIPIPPPISDKIEEQRNKAIECIVTVVHDYITKYLTSDILCSQGGHFSCDANVLGSLLKSSVAIGIWPRPEVPYHGIMFGSLATQIRKMQISDNCNQRNNFHSFSNGHRIKDIINASIRSLEDQFCGLELDLFLPGTKNKKKNKKGTKWGGKKQKKKDKGSIA